ncbi:MAG: hypothetical protein KUG78_20665 [Kangiellaceae bacterium]|nr:hypothetical protein [Kangiellaceae bacterium]
MSINPRKTVFFVLLLALIVFEIWVWSDYIKNKEQQAKTQLASTAESKLKHSKPEISIDMLSIEVLTKYNTIEKVASQKENM